MQNAQNRSESPQMMHLRNNRLQVDASFRRRNALPWSKSPEPSKIRILAIGSTDA
jgi:hypothetical protein